MRLEMGLGEWLSGTELKGTLTLSTHTDEGRLGSGLPMAELNPELSEVGEAR